MTRKWAAWFLTAFCPGLAAQAQEPRAPVALAADAAGRFVYVAEAGGRRVAEVDLASEQVAREIPLPEPPSGLMLAGSRLYVTGAAPQGRLHVIDLEAGVIAASLNAGHMPCAPVVLPGGKSACVLNRFASEAAFLDLESGETLARVLLSREPIAAALTPDGNTVVVLNHLPAGAANGGFIAAEVSLIDVARREVRASIPLPNGATAAAGLCLSADGRLVFATHILARYHNPATQLVRGWMNTNALSIIDVANARLSACVLLDDVDRGAANPHGVAANADGRLLAVAHAGTHEVSVIDLPALLEKLSALGEAGRAAAQDDLSFLTGLRRRVPLPGNGPRALVFCGDTICAAEYFSDSLALVTLGGESLEPLAVRSVALGPAAPPEPARRGEMLFHDAGLCFQGWQSCASCHPEGRADALNWDLLNDGLGNPKNTKSLLLAPMSPPAMSLGVRANASAAVHAGVKNILFATLPEEDISCLEAYVAALAPLPSPFLAQGRLSPAAERGRAAFEKAECASCHAGERSTDLKAYDLGLGLGQDEGRAFDTPALIEVWRTAPYLHDGRAPDLRSLFTVHDNGRHGSSASLSEAELSDLLEYLRSL